MLCKSWPPLQVVVCPKPYKGWIHAASRRCRKPLLSASTRGSLLQSSIFFSILFLLLQDVLFDRLFCDIPYGRHVIASCPEMTIPFVPRSGCLSNIISADSPFKYPMKFDTLNFGGILTLKCTWSLHTAPSIISTFLYPQSVFMISRTSSRTRPYNALRRYFGINTIWYSHLKLKQSERASSKLSN